MTFGPMLGEGMTGVATATQVLYPDIPLAGPAGIPYNFAAVPYYEAQFYEQAAFQPGEFSRSVLPATPVTPQTSIVMPSPALAIPVAGMIAGLTMLSDAPSAEQNKAEIAAREAYQRQQVWSGQLAVFEQQASQFMQFKQLPSGQVLPLKASEYQFPLTGWEPAAPTVQQAAAVQSPLPVIAEPFVDPIQAQQVALRLMTSTAVQPAVQPVASLQQAVAVQSLPLTGPSQIPQGQPSVSPGYQPMPMIIQSGMDPGILAGLLGGLSGNQGPAGDQRAGAGAFINIKVTNKSVNQSNSGWIWEEEL